MFLSSDRCTRSHVLKAGTNGPSPCFNQHDQKLYNIVPANFMSWVCFSSPLRMSKPVNGFFCRVVIFITWGGGEVKGW